MRMKEVVHGMKELALGLLLIRVSEILTCAKKDGCPFGFEAKKNQ
jgi:hypothetical protein